MKYYEGISFAMADMQLKSRNIKKNYPFYYGLQFVHSGEIALSIDKKKEIVKQGPVAFLTCPEHYYEYSSPGTEARNHYWVCFYGAKTEQYLNEELFRINPESPFFNIRQPEHFLSQMEELIALVQSGKEHDRAVCLLESMLFTVQSDSGTASEIPDYYKERFAKLLSRIRKNPEMEWDFGSEAKKMSVSLNHFNRLFRKYHRTSPHHFVIQCRMRKAADDLLNTSLSIAETAMANGIENEFYFSRLFKKKFGLSPSDYRKEFSVQ